MNLEAQIREAVIKISIYPKNRHCCSLYDIGGKLLAKPFRDLDLAQREFEIGLLLYQNEVQVPKFHDLVYLSDFDEEGEDPHYIVMDKIIGREGLELEGHIKELAVGQLLVEVEKIIDLTIDPFDCDNPSNVIFNFEDNKLYLVDFGMYYRIKGPKNLQELGENYKRNIMDMYGY